MAGTKQCSLSCSRLQNRASPRWAMWGALGHWQESSRRPRDTTGSQIRSLRPTTPSWSNDIPPPSTNPHKEDTQGRSVQICLCHPKQVATKHPLLSLRQGAHVAGRAAQGHCDKLGRTELTSFLKCLLLRNISSNRSVFLDQGCSGQHSNPSGIENQLALISGKAVSYRSHSRGVGGLCV